MLINFLLQKNKLNNCFPQQFALSKRFWRFLVAEEVISLTNTLFTYSLDFEFALWVSTWYISLQGLDGDVPWATVSNNNLNSIALLLKQFPFKVVGKVSLLSILCTHWYSIKNLLSLAIVKDSKNHDSCLYFNIGPI